MSCFQLLVLFFCSEGNSNVLLPTLSPSFLFRRFFFLYTNLRLSSRSGELLILYLIKTLFIFAADLNECTALASACHVNAQCHNTIGSYGCTCNPGFTGNGKTCTGTQFRNGKVIRKYIVQSINLFLKNLRG